MDIEDAAKRAHVKPAQLRAWEARNGTPTLRQLRNIANAYKRSVSVFFLRQRPEPLRLPSDFRRLELSASGRLAPELAIAIREAYAKREAALDIYAQMEEEPPAFRLTLPPEMPPEAAGAFLIDRLAMPVERRIQWRSDYDALNAWRAAVEEQGVLVMQASGVSVSEMRGCSLSLAPLPIIILNSADRPLGRIFTLLHELTHLTGHASTLCDFSEAPLTSRAVAQVERYCNHVAGAALVPRDDLLAQPMVAGATRDSVWSDEQLADLKGRYWASKEAVLRRLRIIGKTTAEFYQQRRDEFLEEYRALAEASGGFAYWHQKVIARNGRLLTGLVLDAYNASAITGSEVSRVLGTKLEHLPNIEAAMRGRDAA